MKLRPAAAIAVLVVLPALAAAFPPRAQPESARQLRGFLAVRGGKVIAAENAGQLFVPASVAKLFVAAAALHHLGPEHRRTTTIVAPKVGEDGVVRGDLVVRAAGDPTWNRHFHQGDARFPTRELARQVRERGIVRVEGSLVVDTSIFPGGAWGAGWPISERGLWYGAPASALAIDENAFPVGLAPGPSVGAPARVTAKTWFSVENRTVTVGKERHERGTVELLPSTAAPGIVVLGEYPISEPPYSVRASIPAPDEHAGRALLEALAKAGVEVTGGLRVSREPVNVPREEAVATFVSPPLAEILERVLRASHNWYAEMLARILGREVGGQGRLDVGLDVATELLEKVVRVPKGSLHLEDASGLSPDNLASPEAVVALLLHAHARPWAAAFVGALAHGASGTLRGWSGLPATLRAKTGTIRHTVSLAGYVDPADPSPTAFAVFVNHRLGDRRQARREIGALVRGWK